MALTRVRADQISDIDYKQAVRVITLTSITLAGGAPSQVDGVTLVAGDRVLVAGQSTGSQNGIYRVVTLGTGSNGTWVRTSDANATGEIQAGMIVMVTEGTIWQDTSWKLTTNNPITIGSTALVFAQNTGDSFSTMIANGVSVQANTVSSAVTYTPGNNFVITGNNTSDTITFAVADAPVFTGNIQANYFIGNGSQLTGLSATYGNANVAAYLPTYTGNISAGNVITDNIVSSGNIFFAGNLLPAANVYTLGSVAFPWADATFGPNSISILDTTGNTANTVVIQNDAGNVTMGTAGFEIQTLGTGTSVFRIAALTGQIFSNAETIIANTVNSANVSSGSLQTAGGAGIALDLHVGGNVFATYYSGDGSQLTGIAPTVQIYEFANTITTGGYLQATWLGDFVPGPSTRVSQTVTTTPTLLAAFLTQTNYPGITIVPVGIITVHAETQKNSGNRDYSCYAEIWKRTSGGVETLLLTSDTTSLSSENSIIQQTVTASVAVPISLDITDRILVKLYAVMATGSATIATIFDNSTNTGLQLPALPASINQFVPYTNATTNVDLGAYRITANGVVSTGTISATGNITGNYILGNGTALTGVANAAALASTDANVSNLTASLGNTNSNVSNLTNSLSNTNSNVSSIASNVTTLQGQVYTNANVFTYLANSNVVISTTGNITGSYILGNGALLTGLPATYSNVNVAAYLASNTDPTILAIDSNIGNTNSNVANLSTALGNTNSNVASLSNSLSNTNSNVANLTTSLGNTNSNVASLSNSLSNTNSNVANIASNVATLQGQVYTNANVAAYLPTYTGNLAAGNVITTANATITNQNISIVGNTIRSTDTTMFIDPAGGGAGLTGNVIIQGNLTVNGTTTTIDSNVITINDLAINLANNAATAAAANGGGIEVGPVGGAYITWLYNNVNNTWTSSANISAVGNVAGTFFLGNGSQLTGIATSTALANTDANVANLTTALSNTNSNVSNVASNVTTLQGQVYANANVFSYLGSNSNVTITTTGNITTGANISGTYLLGNGAFISGLPASYGNANVADYLPTYTGNILSGNISTTGTVVINGNTQSGNSSVVGNVRAGNASVTGNTSTANLSVTSTATVGNITFTSTGIRIGLGAGNVNQGANSIAIGVNAGAVNQPANSIILNASGNSLNPTGNGFFVNPVRGDDSNIGNAVYFNPATYELTYSVAAPYIIWDNGGDMGIVTEPVTVTQDLGLVTEAITQYYDLGIVTPDSSGPTVLTSYTVSTLPSASTAGSMVYVTNAPGGAVPAFADGLNWYSVVDRTLIA